MGSSNLSYYIKEGIKNFWTNRLMTMASITILTACLIMMGVVILISFNINSIITDIELQNEIVVFLDEDISDDAAENFSDILLRVDNIRRVEFVSKDEALRDYEIQYLGQPNALEGVVENPLRHSYRVFLSDISKSQSTIDTLSKISTIKNIRDRKDVTQSLINLKAVLTTVSLGVFLLLFFVALFIISNTIKLAMFARSKEINIMKYVGATNWFVRWPFIIEGIIIGLFSSVLAYFATWGIYMYLLREVMSGIEIVRMLSFETLSMYLIYGFGSAGAAVGIVGSAFSVRKYLKV